MKILILGGTGLISTSITRYLLERGDEVTLYNRGKRSQEFAGRVKEIHGDRKEFAAFEKQMKEAGTFDCVIDMICFMPEEAQSDVRAFSGRVGQLIFCSTVDVYLRPASRYPYREDEVRESLSSYGQNKVLCERIFDEAFSRKALNTTILRPAHTYNDSGAIIHSFGWTTSMLDRMRKGRPVIVHGDGNSLWASCHADDVGRGFVNAIGNLRAYGKGYHLPGEQWMTWNQYHATVAEALGVACPELVHIPTDVLAKVAPRQAGVCWPNFQYTNIFDTAAARQDLGFAYTIPWLQGCQRIIRHLNRHNGIANSDNDRFYNTLIETWRKVTPMLQEAVGPDA